MFTLDTNILIYYAKGEEHTTRFVLSCLEQGKALFLPTIAAVEFLSFPPLTQEERTFFASLLPQLAVIPLDPPVARMAADIRREHRVKLADSVVAATALFTTSSLATRNQRDFKKIPNLQLTAV